MTLPDENNAATATNKARSRPGIELKGSDVWISELISFFLVSAVLFSLLFVTAKIFRKEFTIRDLQKQIALLRQQELHLTIDLDNLREKNRISSLLFTIIGLRSSPQMIHNLTELVITNSRQFGYDPLLLLAVISVESSFDPNALGRFRSGNLSGALGLMQVKYETALEVAEMIGIDNLKREDLFNPEINLVIGTAYLTKLISQFGDFKLGLLAYNQGPGTIRETISGRQPLSVRYYERVLKNYYQLSERYREQE